MRCATLTFLALTLVACGDDDTRLDDSGTDGGRDTGADGAMDDSGGVDAGLDAGHDAGPDAGGDAGVDADRDVGPDAGGPACRLGTSCGPARFCDYPDTCGVDGTDGMCAARPGDCPEDCPGVCACDGRSYCNACLAAQAGVDVDPDGECEVRDPCVAMDANSRGDCDAIVGYAYNGTRCVTVNCECVGTDCGSLYSTSTECEAATTECRGGATCGGIAGLPCASGEFCAYPCMTFPDAAGTCRPQPADCSGALPSPVCGCDGMTYASQCEADRAMVTVASAGACGDRRSCGGFLGETCSDTEFCSYGRGDFCGAADATGTCDMRPDLCPFIFAPVCGCDGMTYDNECFANSMGTSAASDGACGT